MKKNKQKESIPGKQNTSAIKQTERPIASVVDSKGSFFSSFSVEEKISLALLFCLVVFVVFVRSKFLSIPFERDEGAYGYYGKLLMEGKIPYKDFYEQKYPGIFYFYGFMVSVFGDTVEGLHTGFIFLNVGTIILIYGAARNLFTPIAGLISAITFGIVSLTPFLSGFTVQSEHGVAFFTSLGLFFFSLYNNNGKWLHVFLMGVSFGCGFMVKTSGVFFILWGGLILIINFFFDKKKSFKDIIAQVSIYSGGVFLFIVILFFIIFCKGSFKEMIFWSYEIPKKYVGKIPLETGLKYFGYTKDAIVKDHDFFWIHSFLAVIVCLFKSIDYKRKLFGITLLFFSFCTIVPGFYFYGHYWIMSLPGLAMASGLTYYSIITIMSSGFKIKFNGLKYIYLTIFGIFVCSHVSAYGDYYFNPNYEAILRAVYGNNPFPEAYDVANYITANSKPEDGLVVVGSEPEMYFYTKKKSPSRHAYFAAIVDNVPEHHEWQREFVRDVEKAKPRYFVFFNHGLSLFVQPNTDTYVFDWMKTYIDSNYRIIGVVDMIDGQSSVYKWKENALTYRPVSKNIIYVFERKQ